MGDIFEDCYYSLSHEALTIGNSRIEHRVAVSGVLTSLYLTNKRSRYIWQNTARVPLTSLIGAISSVRAYSLISDNNGLSDRHLAVTCSFNDDTARLVYTIYPGMPFITSRLFVIPPARASEQKKSVASGIEGAPVATPAAMDAIYTLGMSEKHLRMNAYEIYDVTDEHDMLVTNTEEELYHTRTRSFRGNIFIMTRTLSDDALMIVKEGPTPYGSLNRTGDDIFVRASSSVTVCGSGLGDETAMMPCYGVTIGTPGADAAREYARLYARVHKNTSNGTLRIMSNTWGDRNQDKAVNEAFMLNECTLAKAIGVDIVQIDDGWQKGASANSLLKKSTAWGSYYETDPDFWAVHREKFPNGLTPLAVYAKEHGFELGLWFSPDSTNEYAAFEKDADVLLSLYRTYGIRHFKLDGIKLTSKTAETRIASLLALLHDKSGGRITFNLDATAQVRFGYLYEKQYGTIFVENRYSDWGNYFPHRTLKNLWLLSMFIPPRKFQFEVLNPRRNADAYGDDPLAPAAYGIDYIFASVMVSNPLLWMEMQYLTDDDTAALAAVAGIFRKERDALHNAEIRPIGAMPNGTSFTGFQAITGDGGGYLILLREYTKMDTAVFTLADVGSSITVDVLSANDPSGFSCDGTVQDSAIRITMKKPRSYVFLRYTNA